jgi:broad specificity phosphatase PhoE
MYSDAMMGSVRVLLIVALAATADGLRAQEAIYVVRHAERADESADAELSSEGVRRSNALSALLAMAGVSRIFTSERKRTIQTAAPLARALHIESAIVNASDEDALIQRVRGSRPSDRVLIVGHSNTVPSIIRRLGAKERITIPDGEFDNLFIVVPQKGGVPILLRLKY